MKSRLKTYDVLVTEEVKYLVRGIRAHTPQLAEEKAVAHVIDDAKRDRHCFSHVASRYAEAGQRNKGKQ